MSIDILNFLRVRKKGSVSIITSLYRPQRDQDGIAKWHVGTSVICPEALLYHFYHFNRLGRERELLLVETSNSYLGNLVFINQILIDYHV